jgi:uncharacterized membrane protein YkoI
MTKLSRAVQQAFIFVLFNGVSANSKQQNRTIMKIKMIICFALATTLLTGCINVKVQCPCGQQKTGEKSESWEKNGDKEKNEKGEKGEKSEAKNKEASQAKLMAEAKISKEAAQQTALAKAPNGTVKECEIEMEKGKLIWSFGFTTPDSKNITEVNVDAITGDVVNVEQETPQAEAKEAAEDASKDKHEKQGEDKD